MSTKELILDGGEQLDGSAKMLRLNDTPDGTCVTIRSVRNDEIVAVLNRGQQHMLMLYLQERIAR